jgi:hypothetical protein
MLVIRKETMKAFQPNAEAGFARRVMDYLKENHAGAEIRLPQQTVTVGALPEDVLRETVRGGLTRAADYHIEWKSTRLSFVVLLFLAAPNFDRHPKAAAFFNREEKIDDEALESWMDEMTDEDWAQVEADYDARAWSLPLD